MTDVPQRSLRLILDWFVCLRREAVNLRTVARRTVRLLCVKAGGPNHGGGVIEEICEELVPAPGLTVHVGSALVVHLGGSRWLVKTLHTDEEGAG